MIKMIELQSKRKLSSYSNFETRSSNVLKYVENIFGPVPIKRANIEPSIVNGNWPILMLFLMLFSL